MLRGLDPRERWRLSRSLRVVVLLVLIPADVVLGFVIQRYVDPTFEAKSFAVLAPLATAVVWFVGEHQRSR